jgi:hypothetical protein
MTKLNERMQEAYSLVEFEKGLPAMLDEIDQMEIEIEPTKKAITSKKTEVKAFMVASGLRDYEDGDWKVSLIEKVRKTLNVDLVQKAVSKTMWARITAYVDPNNGKRPKRAYVETTSDTLTIKREADAVVVESVVPVEVN